MLSRAVRLLAAIAAMGWVLLPAAPAAAASHSVMMMNYAYGPASLTVTAGDSVTWTNHDQAQHDVLVTNGPITFDGPLIGKGQTWTYTFGTAGTYSYICSIHPDMKGTIVVKPRSAQGGAGTGSRQGSTGGGVTWTTPSSSPSASPSPSASAAAPVAPASSPSPPSAHPPSTAAADDSTPGLSPLLIVAGISVAVVVFCLLLMTSRPVAVTAAPAPPQPAPARSEADTAVLPEVPDTP